MPLRHLFPLSLILLVTLLSSACNTTETSAPSVHTASAIPSPSKMRVDLTLTGRVSTLNGLDIEHVGKQIPYTYSEGKIFNSPDYTWWVSKHFALKSDLPKEKAVLYLELLEMSYPHYVEIFGAAPANIERQRIAVVYGSSRAKVREAMLDDGFRRGIHASAGGETMYYNRAGYSFPSEREQHQRYIVIHETMHAFQMALMGHASWAPQWITEGLADAAAHHVYDSKRKQLSVFVFDRAPMNYVELGLKQYQEDKQPTIEQITNNPALRRGLNFLLVHYLLDDPERAQYFSLFRDRLMQANPHSEQTLVVSKQLLQQTFPDWEALESEFKHYVENAGSSFSIVHGPWEQDGNAYWIRVREEKQPPRLAINITPRGVATQKPFSFDFPAPLPTPLVDPANRGDTPTIGLLINYIPEQQHRGMVGINLGEHLSIRIREGRHIEIEPTHAEMPYAAEEIASSLLAELAADKNAALGVTIKFDYSGLQLLLRAGNAEQLVRYGISPQFRNVLLDSTVSLVAENASHRLTPYLNDGRKLRERKSTTAINAWEFTHANLLQRVFRACQHSADLRMQCSAPLKAVYSAVKLGTTANDAAEELLRLEAQLSDVAAKTQDSELAATLSGVRGQVAYHHASPFFSLYNPTALPVKMNAEIVWRDPSGKLPVINSLPQSNYPQGLHTLPISPPLDAESLTLNQHYVWNNIAFSLQDTASARPFNGVEIDSKLELEGETLRVTTRIMGPYSGESKGTLNVEVFPSSAVRNSRASTSISFAPYETLEQQQEFTLSPTFNGRISTEVSATVDVDGEAIELTSRGELQVLQ